MTNRLVVKEKEDIQIECEIQENGYPPNATLTYQILNGTRKINNSSYFVLNESSRYDSGVYMCIVESLYENISSIANSTVEVEIACKLYLQIVSHMVICGVLSSMTIM